jgi:Na+/H+ antiporter NhaD/arsenite permease-like protein
MSGMQIAVLSLAVAMYAVVIIKGDWKAWAALITAAIMMALGVVGVKESFTTLINWDVLAIYVGSLVIAELFIYSNAPACIADRIIARSSNVGLSIIAILVLTGLISAVVDNVATVLLMAPICLSLCRKLKMDPTYFMIGLAVMANLQGTATLVGDPPSMIFATFAHYGFNDFFFYDGRISIFWFVQIGMVAGAVYFWLYFRRWNEKPVVMREKKLLSFVPTILLIAMIIGLAICSFIFGGLSAASGIFVMALAVIGLFWYRFSQKKGRSEVRRLVRGLDWETILFLIGVFVVVGAVQKSGLLDLLAESLGRAIGGNVVLGFVLIILVSVIVSGFVDNVPYIMVMLPVAASLSQSMNLQPELYMFALLIGSCLGGNLTPFGASANIVAMGILKKEGHKMNFADWLKIGVPFTLITTVASSVALYFVWR